MFYYVPLTDQELSQRKKEEYEQYCKVISWGRKAPVLFCEWAFGIKLLDYQKWLVMESWYRPFVCWLQARGGGKSVLAAVYLMAKMLLIPDYATYISTNSATQSIETFRKLEYIALQRIPSFKSATDLFAYEVEKSGISETGFIHNPTGNTFRLFNNSSLTTLSSNTNTIRGKRGSVLLDETAWQTDEQLAAVENFINVDASFGLSVNKKQYHSPKQIPLQLLYASSAGDISYPFYDRYRSISKKMLLGHPDYFASDLNALTILNHSTLDGEPIQSHLTKEQIEKAFEEDRERAERELMNRFSKGATRNAITSMDAIIKNSTVRPPLLHNDTGRKRFIFAYDPARNFDNSILSIFQIVDDSKTGYRLQLENIVQMVDLDTKKKTPLPMPRQLKIIKDLMVRYNGSERAAEWENLLFYIDSGAGGGGISAVADALMDDWTDELGQQHRGIIDPTHKQYDSSRRKYTNAMPIVRLIDPAAYKKIIFDSLEKALRLNLIDFPTYDGKEVLLLHDDGELYEYRLTQDEQMALAQCSLAVNELIYMVRTETPSGGVTYEMQKDKKNTLHDDRAYTLAMAAYALMLMRRTDLVTPERKQTDVSAFTSLARKPKIYNE